MIGMAVGIDYSLFYLRREREERRRGRSAHDALLHAARTSGQAVLISGATVLIAMAGMFVSGNSLFATIGLGTMIVVLAAMVGSLTVLPALLSRLGDRVEWGRVPYFGRGSRDDGRWARFIAAVLRQPWAAMLVSAGALLILALPALEHAHEAPEPDRPARTTWRSSAPTTRSSRPSRARRRPRSWWSRRRASTPPRCSTPTTASGSAPLATGQLFEPFTVSMNPDRTVARIDFAIAGNGDNEASVAALHTLRDEVIPPIAKTLPGAEVAVTGVTAGTYDFNHQMLARLPWVFLFVLGLAFTLLLLTFRSMVIAATAVVLNLLSVGAAYGILVAVFQHGWLAGPLRFQTNGAIVSWLPLFLFVVLFGLSMDYHVFILSRIKELHDARRPHRQRDPARDHAHRGHRHQCGDHHGRGLRSLREPEPDHDAADGLRPGDRRPDRRDRDPRRPRPVHDEDPRRVELVPPALARMAPHRHTPKRPAGHASCNSVNTSAGGNTPLGHARHRRLRLQGSELRATVTSMPCTLVERAMSAGRRG